MRSTMRFFISVLAMFAILASCRGGGDYSAPAPFGGEAPKAADRYTTLTTESPEPTASPEAQLNLPEGQQAAQERMVIKTATLRGEVEKYDPWMGQVKELIVRYRGYIVHTSTRRDYDEMLSGQTTIRVPQDKFDNLLADLKKNLRKIEGEEISGQDITEEFFDLSARLENQKRAEERLREILRSAKSVQDVLQVEQELTRVRENIERMEGRKKYLQDQVSYSTITVEWHEPYPLVAGRQGRGFWGMILRGFEEGIEGFAGALSGLITFLIAGFPIYGFIILVIWLAVWATRRGFLKFRKARPVGFKPGETPNKNKS